MQSMHPAHHLKWKAIGVAYNSSMICSREMEIDRCNDSEGGQIVIKMFNLELD